ncbi:MAG: cataboliteactivator [Candidatus Scalindua rubra]|uniref:Cataboliteactivator n=1 Tax=Candidatus Scalindua rubra TaxID=1872076 RepID=A0A1E3X6P8_9BACT|nr:MAG: cataboliteactivator [Candidatus Scalindua rubra]
MLEKMRNDLFLFNDINSSLINCLDVISNTGGGDVSKHFDKEININSKLLVSVVDLINQRFSNAIKESTKLITQLENCFQKKKTEMAYTN